MITTSAKIDLISGGDILGATSSNSGVGEIPFGKTAKDCSGSFVGWTLSDENGNFAPPYQIEVESETPLKAIAIAFDKENSRYPKKITLKHEMIMLTSYIQGTDMSSNVQYWFKLDIEEQAELPFKIQKSLIPTVDNMNYISIDEPWYDENGYNFRITYPPTANPPQSVHAFLLFPLNKNETYTDDDSVYVIKLPENNILKKLVFEIPNWNTPNSPLVISGIYSNISLDINRRNLISLNRNIVDRSDIKFPSYGIISNVGNIEFNDLDGEVRDYAERLILTSDLKVTIKLNNTLSKTSEQIGEFETRTWDYDNNNRSVSVSLKDDLEEWQDIISENIPLTNKNTAYYIYSVLRKRTPDKFDFEELDAYTRLFLEQYEIEFPYLKKSSLWAQWTKLCEACGLHIYKNNRNKIVVIHEFGG